MPRKILAPHKEQDGWRYYRFRKLFLDRDSGYVVSWYNDSAPSSRIISSRRVEEAVETADFLKLCADDGLTVSKFPPPRSADMFWRVEKYPALTIAGYGATLREAYYRYKAEAELDAQQPGPFGNETEPVDDERYCFNCCHWGTPDYEQPCQDCMNDNNANDKHGDWTRPEWEPAND